MAGSKTHEQQVRTFEKKEDVPKRHESLKHPEHEHSRAMRNPDARQSEMPVSQRGLNDEDREHNNPSDAWRNGNGD